MGHKLAGVYLTKALLALLIPSLTVAQQSIEPLPNFQSLSNAYSNDSARPKRQLFREDIPGNRPLSGNLYALHHGFPHPGRWADGQRSEHKPNPRLPPPHQAYIDMLDGSRRGRYYGNSHSGYSGGYRQRQPHHYQPKYPTGHHHQQQQLNHYHSSGGSVRPPPSSVSFGSDIFHPSGGGGGASVSSNGVGGGSHYSGPPKSHQQFEFPQFDLKNVAFGIHPGPSQYGVPKVPQGPVDLKSIAFGHPPSGGGGSGSTEYGPPPVGPTGPSSSGLSHEGPEYETSQPTQPNSGDDEHAYVLQHALSQDERKNNNKPVKAIVHYHPVEYGNIINIPEKVHEDEYSGSIGPEEPSPPSSQQYGPPNHSGGLPLGPSYSSESGFVPSKGPQGHPHESSGGSKENPFAPYHFPNSAPNSNTQGSFFHSSNEGSKFDPFNFFSNSNRPSYGPPPKQYTNSNQIDHDIPVAIPILAQFHTAKPIKFSKFKRPLHLVYGHRPHPHHSPPLRQHYERSHFYNRIPKQPRWMTQHGLK